jgi:hypothetical protein
MVGLRFAAIGYQKMASRVSVEVSFASGSHVQSGV